MTEAMGRTEKGKAPLRVLIVDGQGGGLGRQLTEALRGAKIPCEITAVGANTAATAAMLRAGADQGATGENAVRVCAQRAQVILGPIGIVIADALLGEITPHMARAIGQSPAVKLLLPTGHCSNVVLGTGNVPLKTLIEEAVTRVQEMSMENPCI